MVSLTFLSGPITKTDRTVAVSSALGWIMPYRSDTDRSASATNGKFGAAPWVSSMSRLQRSWASSGSTLSPSTFTSRRSNSPLIRATSPSSLVQTGVKSFGCENNTPQLVPSHSWKRTVPSVVSAVKSGASSPSCSVRAAVVVSMPRPPLRLRPGVSRCTLNVTVGGSGPVESR